MRAASRAILPTLLLIGALEAQVLPTDNWDLANEEITRLSPADFDSLPVSVREELDRQSCTIPQSFDGAGNVVTGRFTSANQMDIAVLCSRNRISTILVFRNGSTTSVEALASAPDRRFLQAIGADQIGFSRSLGVADPQSIQKYYEAFGGPQPPPWNHDGIEDSFLEKASIIWYWHEGRWLQLRGAD